MQEKLQPVAHEGGFSFSSNICSIDAAGPKRAFLKLFCARFSANRIKSLLGRYWLLAQCHPETRDIGHRAWNAAVRMAAGSAGSMALSASPDFLTTSDRLTLPLFTGLAVNSCFSGLEPDSSTS